MNSEEERVVYLLTISLFHYRIQYMQAFCEKNEENTFVYLDLDPKPRKINQREGKMNKKRQPLRRNEKKKKKTRIIIT